MIAFEKLSESKTRLDLNHLPQEPKRQSNEKTEYDLADLKSALYSLPIKYVDSYSDWIKIGMALYHTDPELLWLWKQWSQRSDRYQDGDCESKWDSFATTGERVTVGTLFHLATKEDWRFPDHGSNDSGGTGITYNVLSSDQLNSGDYTPEWLIGGLLVAKQPCIIGGPQKTLKTTLAVDAGISVATGTRFVNGYETKQARTLIMSGESGLSVLQETMRRVCRSRGITPNDVGDQLQWCTQLPRFGQSDYIRPLETLLRDNGTQVLIIDPVYLAMPGNDAGNLMVQGELLRSISDVCNDLGITLVLCHHFVKQASKNSKPPLLTDLAWSGFAEFARQWWLLKRRSDYVEGSGDHDLWMTVGGSAGHSELLVLDIKEGRLDDEGGRKWDVNVQTNSQAKSHTEQQETEAKCAYVVQVLDDNGPLIQKEFYQLTGLNWRSWQRLAPKLPQVEVVPSKDDRRKKLFRLKETR